MNNGLYFLYRSTLSGAKCDRLIGRRINIRKTMDESEKQCTVFILYYLCAN